jgi:hypothetical protein
MLRVCNLWRGIPHTSLISVAVYVGIARIDRVQICIQNVEQSLRVNFHLLIDHESTFVTSKEFISET